MIRWGIIGTGGIASTFASDLARTGSGTVFAVGSRRETGAEEFGERFAVPNRHVGYEALVADPQVDAVYVATPHPMHHEDALLALRAGKHVLVEKPFTMNAAEAEELVAEARERGLFLMEAMWTRFLPHIAAIRRLLRAGSRSSWPVRSSSAATTAPPRRRPRISSATCTSRGCAVGGDNVVDAAQVRATTAAVTKAHAADGRSFPPVIGVDQEGGVVAHLDGVATTFPPFQEAGDAIAAGPRQGRAVVRKAAASTAMELRMLGFTWVFAPVADVTIGAADPTIGSRSPSQDPKTAAAAIGAAVPGYDEAGVVSTTKHFPGHGSVTADSHEVLPELDASLETLRERDLGPSRRRSMRGPPRS